MIFIGGDEVKWGSAAKIDIMSDAAITAYKGTENQRLVEGELGRWYHFRAVFDFENKTYDFYVDGEQAADDFDFRGEGGKGGVNPNLGWIFFGWDKEDPLVAYIDDIEMGDGEGEEAGASQAVSPAAKLTITWGDIKEAD